MKIFSRLAATLLCGTMILGLGCAAKNSASANRLMTPPGTVDADAPTEFSSTTTGLKYRVLRKGTGTKPTDRNMVTVNYQGWLDNGTVFDSSYDRGEPATFGLREVIPGWTEGLQLVAEGGLIELQIPSDLGYGPSGTQGIPGNSTLHFYVELLKVQ